MILQQNLLNLFKKVLNIFLIFYLLLRFSQKDRTITDLHPRSIRYHIWKEISLRWLHAGILDSSMTDLQVPFIRVSMNFATITPREHFSSTTSSSLSIVEMLFNWTQLPYVAEKKTMRDGVYIYIYIYIRLVYYTYAWHVSYWIDSNVGSIDSRWFRYWRIPAYQALPYSPTRFFFPPPPLFRQDPSTIAIYFP